MKLLTMMLVASAGLGLFFANALEYGSPAASLTSIEPGSVAHYCARAVPEIVDEFERQPDSKLSFLERATGTAVFKRVGTSFCLCADEAYSPKGVDKENEVFGSLAGLYLKLYFSSTLSREYREKLKKEGQDIYLANKAMLRRNPQILESTNETFNDCRKKQNVSRRS